MPSCTNRPQIIMSKLDLKLTGILIIINIENLGVYLYFSLKMMINWYVRIWRSICSIWGLMWKADLILDYWGILQVLALCGLVFSIIENNQTAFNSFQNNDDTGERSQINDKAINILILIDTLTLFEDFKDRVEVWKWTWRLTLLHNCFLNSKLHCNDCTVLENSDMDISRTQVVLELKTTCHQRIINAMYNCSCWKTVIWIILISRGQYIEVAWRQYMLNVMNTDDKTKLPGPLVKEILDQIPYCRYLRKYWTNPKEILVEIQYWRYLRKHQTNPKEILDKI